LIAVSTAWRRLRVTTLVALGASAVSLAVSATVGAISAVQWADAVPGSGLTLGLTLASTVGVGAVAVTALAYAFRSAVRVATLG
jgi:hypothetical protein